MGLTKILFWTFVHSLWQGLALAVAAWLFGLFSRKLSAALRYNVLLVLFLVFIAGTGISFAWQWNLQMKHTEEVFTGISSVNSLPALSPVSQAAPVVSAPPAPPAAKSAWLQVVSFLNANASLLLTLWFVFFCIRFFRMITGLVYVHRLRHRKISFPDQVWTDKLEKIMAGFNIGRRIKLLESALVSSPLTIGVLKPIILVPVGLLASLPADQVEAVLAHELAHIRRSDYLVNLLQSLVEVVFFFNPGIRWISARIREEREHCCDDLAISVTQNRATMVHALISCGEYHVGRTRLAMGFSTRRNHLLYRIERLILPKNKTSKNNIMEKLAIGFGLVVIVVVALVVMQSFKARKKIQSVVPVMQEKLMDTVPANQASPGRPVKVGEGTSVRFQEKKNGKTRDVYIFNQNGKVYEFVGNGGKDMKLTIDNKPVPKAELERHRVMLDTFVAAGSSMIDSSKLVADYRNDKFKSAAQNRLQAFRSRNPKFNQANEPGPAVVDGKTRVPYFPGNKGLVSHGEVTRYFGNGYEIVERGGKITGVYYKGELVPEDKLKEQKSSVDKVIRDAKSSSSPELIQN